MVHCMFLIYDTFLQVKQIRRGDLLKKTEGTSTIGTTFYYIFHLPSLLDIALGCRLIAAIAFSYAYERHWSLEFL